MLTPGIGRSVGNAVTQLARKRSLGVTNTVTLISGERDAVLVDTFLSVQHSKELVEWVAASGKNLTYIYVTLTATTSSV